MDETDGDASTIDPSRKRAAIALLLLVAAGMAPFLFHRGALIDHIPTIYTVIAAVVGGVLGGFLSAWLGPLKTGEPPVRAAILAITITVIAIVTATFYARMAVEAAAFTAFKPATSELKAPITGMNGKWRYTFNLAPEPGSRTMIVRVTSEAYAMADPYREPGRDCLLIAIETGRGGVRRMRVPNLLDESIGADRVVPCT